MSKKTKIYNIKLTESREADLNFYKQAIAMTNGQIAAASQPDSPYAKDLPKLRAYLTDLQKMLVQVQNLGESTRAIKLVDGMKHDTLINQLLQSVGQQKKEAKNPELMDKYITALENALNILRAPQIKEAVNPENLWKKFEELGFEIADATEVLGLIVGEREFEMQKARIAKLKAEYKKAFQALAKAGQIPDSEIPAWLYDAPVKEKSFREQLRQELLGK
jgi:hypothetical protein